MLDMWLRWFLPHKCPGGSSLYTVPVRPRCDTPVSQQTAMWVARSASTWQTWPSLLPLIFVADHGQSSHQRISTTWGDINIQGYFFYCIILYIEKLLGLKVLFWPWAIRQPRHISHYKNCIVFDLQLSEDINQQFWVLNVECRNCKYSGMNVWMSFSDQ